MPLPCYNCCHRRLSTDKLQHIGAPLDAIQDKISGASLAALRALRRASQQQGDRVYPLVYLVGGPVRDLLLGRPIQDLDFAVEGDAPSLARLLTKEIDGHLVIHAKFGTASVNAGDARIDLATARRESYAKPGVLPQVTPASIQEDLARRDFSINAMALPLADGQPTILDPFGGLEDLGLGSVRILHPQSFVDDPTRIFRAVRYEQRLSFRMDEDTLVHLAAAVAERRVSGLTGDRVRHELQRIFQEARPELALRRALELGVLTEVHPGLTNLDPADQLSSFEKDAGTPGHCFGELVWLAALAYPLENAQGESLIQRLNMPGNWQRAVRSAIDLRGIEPRLGSADLSGSGLVHLLEGFSEDALRAALMVSGSERVKQRVAEYLDRLRYTSLELDGGDLQALGVPQGPEIGEILMRLRDARLDGSVSTKSGQLKMVQEILAEKEAGGPGLGVGHG